MVKKVGMKRNIHEVEDETTSVIQALKESNNYLKNDITKLKMENKDLKEQIQVYSKVIKCCRYFLYSSIAINVIALVGVVINEKRR